MLAGKADYDRSAEELLLARWIGASPSIRPPTVGALARAPDALRRASSRSSANAIEPRPSATARERP
jgi:hypothetical protein